MTSRDVVIHIRISPKLHDLLRSYADKHDWKLSHLVNKVLTEKFDPPTRKDKK
jgi:predicted HicB family RNase H-like nuclease